MPLVCLEWDDWWRDGRTGVIDNNDVQQYPHLPLFIVVVIVASQDDHHNGLFEGVAKCVARAVSHARTH